MKLKILAACAAFATFSAGQAMADVIVVKLAAPAPAKAKFVAEGAIFQCEGSTCMAAAASAKSFTVAACRAVAEKVGAIESFASRKALTAEQLASCNEKAKGAAKP